MANPAMAIHLELRNEAVILEGMAEEAGGKVPESVDDAYRKKYKMRLSDAPGDMFLVRLRPQIVLAWTEKEFMNSPTRWEFPRQ